MLYWLVLGPILVATLLYLLPIKQVKTVLILAQTVLLGYVFLLFYHIKTGGIIKEAIGGWSGGRGIELYGDLFAIVLAMLTIFLFTMMFVFTYKKLYMNKLFMFLFMVLQGLINGVFLSNDLFNLYVLIEVSTIIVSILIMFKKDSRSIYDGMIYLLTNIVAMTFFLLGTGYMYHLFGSLDLEFIGRHITRIDPKQLVLPYSLLMTAVGLKSAIMPLFSWLPKAHGTPSAPSSVSAILSGLYVKGGVYLFIRFQLIFNPVLDVHGLFLAMGFLTGVIGFILALAQKDIKLILAYHTVSQIGLILFGLSIGTELSYWGSVYHIINHAIFKSTLFLTAGMISDHYGTRDITKIRGVVKELPVVTMVTVMAFLGITGAPFFNGSISKYFIQKGVVSSGLSIGLMIINLGTIMSFVKYMSMFFGRQTTLVVTDQGVKTSKISKPWLDEKRGVLLILGFCCLGGGIFGTKIIEFLFNQKIKVDLKGYGLKAIYYAINMLIGISFYRYLYQRITLFKKIRSLELSFNNIILSMVIFFGFLTLYLR